MGRGPDRPVKTRGSLHGQGRAAHIEPTSHGPRPITFRDDGPRPGPPRPINFLDDGPRPGPVRHVTFLKFHGPARPINFSKFSTRPGRSYFQNTRPGPARPGPGHPPMTSPDNIKISEYLILRVVYSDARYLVLRSITFDRVLY